MKSGGLQKQTERTKSLCVANKELSSHEKNPEMRSGSLSWDAVADERAVEDEEQLIGRLKMQLSHAHATIGRLESELRAEKATTEDKLSSVKQMVRSFEQEQSAKLNQKEEEMCATRLEAKRGNKDLEQLVQELRAQVDKREQDFQVLNAVLAKKQEDLVFAYEQIRETKEWATEQISSLKGSASGEVAKLRAKVEMIERASESERRGLEEQLDQRNADNKTLQNMLAAEKLRNTHLVSSTTSLSRKIDRELELKLARLEAEVTRVSALGDKMKMHTSEFAPGSQEAKMQPSHRSDTASEESARRHTRLPRKIPDGEYTRTEPPALDGETPAKYSSRTRRPRAAFDSADEENWEEASVKDEYAARTSVRDMQVEAFRSRQWGDEV